MGRLIVGLAVTLVVAATGRAELIVFDFDSGPGPNFSVLNRDDLWTVDTDGPNLRLSKPADDLTDSEILGRVISNFSIHEDFTVTVDFALHDFPDTEAHGRLNESALAVIPESSFGGPLGPTSSLFEVLRYRRDNRNLIEVFTWSPQFARGAFGVADSDLSNGLYRISRSGTTVTGSYAGPNNPTFTPIASVKYSLEPMLVELRAAQVGEFGVIRSQTAPDISFDNLSIQAARIEGYVVPELLPGDANQDYVFNQFDIGQVALANRYLTGQPATWGEGDWDGAPGGAPGSPPLGDGVFDQKDIIAALAADKYLTGPYAASDDVAAVPKPTTLALLTIGIVAAVHWRQIRNDRDGPLAVSVHGPLLAF